MKRQLAVVVLVFSFAAAAHAGYDYTAVASYGSDLNTCEISAPCATFAAAIAQTNAGGELIALDSGAYQGFTIDRKMTITAAPGAVVTIQKAPGVLSDYAIKVDAPGERVSIRGVMVAMTSGAAGIVAYDAERTYIDDVMIEGVGCASGCSTAIFGRKGELYVNNARIRNSFQGIVHNPVAASSALITNSIIENVAGAGVRADNVARAFVRNTVVSHAGVAFTAGSLDEKAFPVLTIQDCAATESTTGISADSNATVRLERTAVTRNTTGLSIDAAGTLISFKNNVVSGNTTDVSGTVTVEPLM